jgi:hypothetical protein
VSAQPPAEVAGAQAAAAESPPPVSSLPPSGGEPDRPVLVAGLLALFLAGLGLRRLSGAHS